jgi:peptidoglycan/xylan/chitin deacetylase (PgdA/CDA1 family)
MHYSLILSSLLAVAGAVPVEDPITIFNRAPSPGTVYTKCSKPNTLALAYDDGPYQYTQSIVNKLNQAGAKATFFFTGTLYGMDTLKSRVSPWPLVAHLTRASAVQSF